MIFLSNSFFVCVLLTLVGKSSSQEENVTEILNKGLSDFTIKMGKLLYKSRENLLFSPINIYTTLTILHLGAEGKTRDEISQVLGIPENSELSKIHQSIGNIIKSIHDSEIFKSIKINQTFETVEALKINLAAGIFLQNGVALKKSYENNLKTYYNGEIIFLDFIKGQEATNIINKYIADKTRNHITNLFTEPQPSNTRIMITSYIYFNALWQLKFEESETKDEVFHRSNGNIVVKTMKKLEFSRYGFIPSLRIETAKIKFSDNIVAMYVGLPVGNQTLDGLIQSLQPNDLNLIIKETNQFVTLNLSLPRTTFKWSKNIKYDLMKLGMFKIFNEEAELSNMIDTNIKDLTVGEVSHATYIDITEKGTEASGVTGMRMSTRSGRIPEKKIVFNVNRPYLAIIYSPKMDSVLFLAAVNDPRGSI